jgi:hypothetical protein
MAGSMYLSIHPQNASRTGLLSDRQASQPEMSMAEWRSMRAGMCSRFSRQVSAAYTICRRLET